MAAVMPPKLSSLSTVGEPLFGAASLGLSSLLLPFAFFTLLVPLISSSFDVVVVAVAVMSSSADSLSPARIAPLASSGMKRRRSVSRKKREGGLWRHLMLWTKILPQQLHRWPTNFSGALQSGRLEDFWTRPCSLFWHSGSCCSTFQICRPVSWRP